MSPDQHASSTALLGEHSAPPLERLLERMARAAARAPIIIYRDTQPLRPYCGSLSAARAVASVLSRRSASGAVSASREPAGQRLRSTLLNSHTLGSQSLR